jgi:hypothetical protein
MDVVVWLRSLGLGKYEAARTPSDRVSLIRHTLVIEPICNRGQYCKRH